MKWYAEVGHGGKDPGAIAIDGQLEKDMTLITALEFKRMMELNGQEVKLSRETDKHVPLNYAAIESNRWGADRVVSIHYNSGSSSADGSEHIHSIHHGVGKELAECIAKSFEIAGQNNRRNFSKASTINPRKDYFGIIRDTNAPAVISEVCFISNSKDFEMFNTPDKYKRAGRIIARGCLLSVGYDLEDIKYW